MTKARKNDISAASADAHLDPASGSRAARARAALERFRVVFSSVKRHFRDIESKCGVSGAQLWAVSGIADNPGVRVSELARAMSVHQSTASNLVGELEKRGLVRKERGHDQRVVRLYLTEEGALLAQRAPQPLIGVLPDALQRLPDDVLDSLSANMDVLIATMHLKDEAAAASPLSDI